MNRVLGQGMIPIKPFFKSKQCHSPTVESGTAFYRKIVCLSHLLIVRKVFWQASPLQNNTYFSCTDKIREEELWRSHLRFHPFRAFSIHIVFVILSLSSVLSFIFAGRGARMLSPAALLRRYWGKLGEARLWLL